MVQHCSLRVKKRSTSSMSLKPDDLQRSEDSSRSCDASGTGNRAEQRGQRSPHTLCLFRRLHDPAGCLGNYAAPSPVAGPDSYPRGVEKRAPRGSDSPGRVDRTSFSSEEAEAIWRHVNCGQQPAHQQRYDERRPNRHSRYDTSSAGAGSNPLQLQERHLTSRLPHPHQAGIPSHPPRLVGRLHGRARRSAQRLAAQAAAGPTLPLSLRRS
ncbi:Hypothetical predicted protein [Scomber scombrus]|uniref:Uncharacterized protein n=1 Tax=Scomber scombrus TaxID=13677 RepID=A0AAV1PNB7_SCOSC